MKSQNILNTITDKLRNNGWIIKANTQHPIPKLNDRFALRYSLMPDEYRFFLSNIFEAVSSDEQSWFTCIKDYNDTNSDTFSWNQFELMSIEVAKEEQDIDWENDVKSFWDCHMPIMISLRSGYSVITIGVCENNFGQIFHGIEPEFEEVTMIANSFSEFLCNMIEKKDMYPYIDFV